MAIVPPAGQEASPALQSGARPPDVSVLPISRRDPRIGPGALLRLLLKLDLTADERVVLSPVVKPIFHPYSDAPEEVDRSRMLARSAALGAIGSRRLGLGRRRRLARAARHVGLGSE